MGLAVLEDKSDGPMARTAVSQFGTRGAKYHILPFIPALGYVGFFQLSFLLLAIYLLMKNKENYMVELQCEEGKSKNKNKNKQTERNTQYKR